MKDLIGIHPTGIVRSAGSISVYYGVQPNAVPNLRANDEFTMVYRTEDKAVWHWVRFRVLEDHKDYDILEMHALEPAEIAYLEGELNPAQDEEQFNPDYALAS